MAIKIRPVRGQIETSTIRGGRNMIRGQEYRGRQFAQAGQIASDFLGNILGPTEKQKEQRAELDQYTIDATGTRNRLAREKAFDIR